MGARPLEHAASRGELLRWFASDILVCCAADEICRQVLDTLGVTQMAKRIDVSTLPVITGTLYPPPFDEPCRARQRTRLPGGAGLTPYGGNLGGLQPGARSS